MAAVTAPQPGLDGAEAATRPLVVVSSDTHIGPRLREDLRSYCPSQYLDDFDAFTAQDMARRQAYRANRSELFFPERIAQDDRNLEAPGHHDVRARLADMDRDGVAAEVVFATSLNMEPLPFQGSSFGYDIATASPRTLELTRVGYGIYNRWLADALSVQPGRHIGLVQLPMWDVEAAVRDLVAAHDAGLRGVNFPVPRPGILPYDDAQWDTFWSLCEERGMALASHAGGTISDRDYVVFEHAGWPARRAMHRMIFGGVFERHPLLRLVLTEQPGNWWEYTLREMDSALQLHMPLSRHVKRKPSEYCATNVFVGASFMARFEAEDAVDNGYTANVLWGSDYPHSEGTWEYVPEPAEGEVPRTKVALHHTFWGMADDEVRAMVGGNAVDVFGLDPAEMAQVAARIGAPTCEDLRAEPQGVPTEHFSLAFRQWGPWA